MTDTASSPVGSAAPRDHTPVHVWIVGVLALLWQLMGVFDYLATQLRAEFYMEQFTPEQLEYFFGFPAWAEFFWALGVWGGLAGAIGILLRRRWAVWMYAISLLGLAGTSVYTVILTDGVTMMGTAGVIFTVVIWAVTIALLLYSMRMSKHRVFV